MLQREATDSVWVVSRDVPPGTHLLLQRAVVLLKLQQLSWNSELAVQEGGGDGVYARWVVWGRGAVEGMGQPQRSRV